MNRPLERSIARRLAVMFAVAALVVFAGVGAALQHILRRELERHQADELRTRSSVVGMLIAKNATLEKFQLVKMRLDALTPIDGSVRFAVRSDDPRFRYGADIDARMLGHTQVVPANGERPEVSFTVAMDPTRFNDTIRAFLIALVVLVTAGAAVVAVLGYRIARSGLGPLRRLSHEAQSISPRNLSQRLDIAMCLLPAANRRVTY